MYVLGDEWVYKVLKFGEERKKGDGQMVRLCTW